MSIYISVFGGSQPKPGEPVYQEALELGKLLAQRGYILLNGWVYRHHGSRFTWRV